MYANAIPTSTRTTKRTTPSSNLQSWALSQYQYSQEQQQQQRMKPRSQTAVIQENIPINTAIREHSSSSSSSSRPRSYDPRSELVDFIQRHQQPVKRPESPRSFQRSTTKLSDAQPLLKRTIARPRPPSTVQKPPQVTNHNPYTRPLPPPQPPTHHSKATQTVSTKVSRATQTDTSIHNDTVVLDLIHQIDQLKQTHANHISEYQEQLIDLELTNRDLHQELEHAQSVSEKRQAVYQRMTEELHERLRMAQTRVEGELGDIKQMHANKCNELSSQVTLLQNRCQQYRAKLLEMGVTPDQLLLVDTSTDDSEGSVIPDQRFIEQQYLETRESRQEASYFRQLMEIEQSMENTTIALGFELKRTQAKYLQQAVDLIREQLQTDHHSRRKSTPKTRPASPPVSTPLTSIESIHTLTSIDPLPPLSQLETSQATLVTPSPPKPVKTFVRRTPPVTTTTTRSHSLAIDTHDMTPEQLLESLKLPSSSGSDSPRIRPRAGSSNDLGRLNISTSSLFDSSQEIKLNLGLSPKSNNTSSRSVGRRTNGHRRRSRSIGTWSGATKISKLPQL